MLSQKEFDQVMQENNFLTCDNKVLRAKLESQEQSTTYYLNQCDRLASYKEDFEFLKEQYAKIPTWIKRMFKAEDLT